MIGFGLFGINVVLQITAVLVLASVAAWLLRRVAAPVRHGLWTGALGLILLVPVAVAVGARAGR